MIVAGVTNDLRILPERPPVSMHRRLGVQTSLTIIEATTKGGKDSHAATLDGLAHPVHMMDNLKYPFLVP